MQLPEWAKRGRGIWRWDGSQRPEFADTPGVGQESVWDYPRPPRLEPDERRIVIRVGGAVIADTTGALRLLETASPPTFYIPPSDIRMELMRPEAGVSRCEWKGTARYWSVRTQEGERVEEAAWSYAEPFPDFEALRDYLAFYPNRVDCVLAGEEVRAQAGGFYAGWITSDVVGPFKGDLGSGGW
ncbi:MAG: DUF427 domain-containing protein [Gemmatimonadetes bacterium]|nr:DUF427 domain-containing protein [Gemmatimonadota bacterium]